MTEPISTRQYTDEELEAIARLDKVMNNQPGRGPMYFAGGSWWPEHLLDMGTKYAQLSQDCLTACRALRREQEREGHQ